jgi:dihydroorotase-like cyclic amidohydrolase
MDLVLKNGTIVSGSAVQRADVGILHGVIATVGLDLQMDEVVDVDRPGSRGPSS